MRSHLWHLVEQAFALVLAWNSATPFSLVKEAVFGPLIIFLFAWCFEFRGDWKRWSVIQTRGRDIIKPFLFTILGSFALLGVVFAVAVPCAIYKDHQSLLRANRNLRSQISKLVDPKSRDDKIATLENRISELEKSSPKQKSQTTNTTAQVPAAPTVPPVEIMGLVVQVRSVCALVDPKIMPEDMAMRVQSVPSYFEGAIGKSYLLSSSASFKRTENEGNAFVLESYTPTPNSDLIGKPISFLLNYTNLHVEATAAANGSFKTCDFVEVSIDVNGREIYRHSETVNENVSGGHAFFLNVPIKPYRQP